MVSLEFLARATAVLLPGSGSDADFVARAFAPLTAHCRAVVACDAVPPTVTGGYRNALDGAAAHGPVLACGVSLGTAVAAGWAVDRDPEATVLVLALPPWTGAPSDAVAALAARATAEQVERHGPAAAIAAMQASSPPWLARELTRSWAAHGDFLAPALREAAGFDAPSTADLARIAADTVVIGARGDLVHPLEMARLWTQAIPGAVGVTVDLADLGPAPSTLGAAAERAWEL
jgi:pimeloyl-ACP methyl ester carboxylesterase